MNEELQRRLRQEDLAFFGKIGADVSHDVRNVLSVIGEYAGLLDDLLELASRGKPPDYAKLRKLSASITRQVTKAAETMERFSRFSHAADEPTASFDLAAVTRNLVALAQRRVAMAGCTLEAEIPDDPVPLSANPFSLQRAVVSAVELILESPEKGEPLRVRLASHGASAVISVSGGAAGGDDLPGRIARLSEVMSELNGSVETSCEGGILLLTLTVPIK